MKFRWYFKRWYRAPNCEFYRINLWADGNYCGSVAGPTRLDGSRGWIVIDHSGVQDAQIFPRRYQAKRRLEVLAAAQIEKEKSLASGGSSKALLVISMPSERRP